MKPWLSVVASTVTLTRSTAGAGAVWASSTSSTDADVMRTRR